MRLVTISGLDGSGKSTQIQLLKKYLEDQGEKVFYFHAIEFGIAKKLNDFRLKYCLLCRLLNRCKVSQPEKSVTCANGLQIFLRRLFLLTDLMRFKKLKARLEKDGYDYILSDRYFYDTIVNLYFLRGSDKRIRCEDKVIRPDAAVYLNADPEAIMSRERKPDQGLEYLQKKKVIYDTKAVAWNMQAVDGNREKAVIFEEIKNLTK